MDLNVDKEMGTCRKKFYRKIPFMAQAVALTTFDFYIRASERGMVKFSATKQRKNEICKN